MSTIRLRIEAFGAQMPERDCAEGEVTFGRGAGCDVVVSHHSMSRRHARIVPGPQQLPFVGIERRVVQ